MSERSIDPTATVGSLWRYAVKSMRGEQLDAALIVEGGVLGDRAYAVIDQSNGKVASAKLPRKWSRLLDLSARLVERPQPDGPIPPVEIKWAGGEVVSDQEGCDRVISEMLDRAVTLTASRPESPSVERLDPFEPGESILDIGPFMMRGRFTDYAPVHLMTTATLARLSELHSGASFEPRRFRPNILIETSADPKGFVENDWIGQVIAIGEEVRLQVTDPTPRCSIPTLSHGELPKDPSVLRTIADHNMLPFSALDGREMPCAGVYASVLQRGTVRMGDSIRIE